MSTSESSEEIPILTWDLDRVEAGKPIKVYYQSNRGGGMKTKDGEITTVERIGENTIKTWFYDEENERKYLVVVKDSFDESVIKSQKNTTPTTRGSVTKVIVPRGECGVVELEQKHLFEQKDEVFDTVVAAAKIKSNKQEVKYLTHGE
jgi:hypothetical protein